MKIIYNKIIPFKGYVAMCIFPFVFVRKDVHRLPTTTINHEKMHGWQQIELLWLLFLIWYGLEYVIRWFAYGFNHNLAYKNICFEQEAYNNEANMDYLRTRKHYSFIKYLFKKTYI